MQVNNNQGGAMEWDALWWDRGRPFRGLRNAGKVLNKLECLSSCSSIQLNHITKTCGRQVIMRCFELFIEQLRTHDFKECFGVHTLSRSKVGSSLLQGAHRGTYAVNSSDT